MSERLFGTDGIRAIPGEHPLVPELVRKVAYLAGSMFRNGAASEPPKVLIGRDTRDSGDKVARWLVEGLAAAGCQAVDLGVIPTPALANLVPRWRAACGIVISASHNPPEFNGIKFFAPTGLKLDPDSERRIETQLASLPDGQRPAGRPAPTLHRGEDAERDYLDFLRSTFPPSLDLSGLKVVLDCANGAACRVGPRLLKSLGATVIPIGISPSGFNINLGFGALETEAMRREVVRQGADAGVALDGDADRAVFADEHGHAADGDVVLSLAAPYLKSRGLLRGDKVVATVMSNFGLLKFLERCGIGTIQVPVGDRSVTEALMRERLSLGGEASGHIVFARYAPTGDGLLTAIQTLAILRAERRPLSHFRKRLTLYPQILKNVPVRQKVPFDELPRFQKRLKELENGMRGQGRLLVRYSGTEPLLRILVEGPKKAALQKLVQDILTAYKKETHEP